MVIFRELNQLNVFSYLYLSEDVLMILIISSQVYLLQFDFT